MNNRNEKQFHRSKIKNETYPEFNLYAGFTPTPPFDWQELRRIMEANAPQLRKMTFRTIPEMTKLARTNPNTRESVIVVGSLALLPFLDSNGYRSVKFQILESTIPSSSVSEGQNRFAPRLWRPK